jgi:hypothetical protein
MMNHFTMAQAHITSMAATHTQQQKFDLHNTQHQTDHSGTEQVMVDLTDRPFHTAAISILS